MKTDGRSGAGSDYISFTKFGYPSAFASEGNLAGDDGIGDYNPYIHSSKDTLDVDDETGVFSFEVRSFQPWYTCS